MRRAPVSEPLAELAPATRRGAGRSAPAGRDGFAAGARGGAGAAGGGRWRVYMLRCADGSLYTGIARDVPRRVREHNGEFGKGARYTRARRPVRLVWQEPCASRGAALRREAEIKALPRRAKLAVLRGG